MPTEPATFTFDDEFGARTLVVPSNEPLWSGNPIPIVRDIEARTRTRLRDGQNPIWFIRVHKHFSDRRDSVDGVSFAEYVARRHADKIEAFHDVRPPSLVRSSDHPEPSGKLARTVQPVHFEDFSGHQFERLVFAYHLRIEKFRTLEWYGQSGSDLGRDIWGVRETGMSLCIQCVNRQTVSATKITRDLDKIARARCGIPDSFLVVCTSSVSATLRDKVKDHAQKKGITHCDIWSGHEFEERLRRDEEALLRRFIDGEQFPDDPGQLRRFADSKVVGDDVVVEGTGKVAITE
jgi:hypothetical protein